MGEFETVLQVVPALGVIAALLFDALTIRNAERIRRKDFIFESNLSRTPEFFKIWYSIQDMWDYETYQEFSKKFSPERQAGYTYVVTVYNVMGTAYVEGVAQADEIFELFPPQFAIGLFEMSWPWIRDLRAASGNVQYLRPFEQLYVEARRRLPGYTPSWQRDLRTSRAVHP